VYVFDDEGLLIEQTCMQAVCFNEETAYNPRRLLTMSPLRVVFGHPKQQNVEEVEEAWSKDGWRKFMTRSEEVYHLPERQRAIFNYNRRTNK
jgi:hypothetical protein